MYNRYIPQPDGTFRRNRIADLSEEQETYINQETTKNAVEQEAKQQIHIPNQDAMKNIQPRKTQRQKMMSQEQNPGSVSGFLKGLLPQNFDTEDLIVVLLLLLISGNNANDQNAALLTLGIYLFM